MFLGDMRTEEHVGFQKLKSVGLCAFRVLLELNL